MNCSVLVEKNAGANAFASDEKYTEAGASVLSREDVLTKSEIILSINLPAENETSLLQSKIILGIYQPLYHHDDIEKFVTKNITVFSIDMLPRTTRAQSMDVLSSQANIAGYKAVLVAADLYPRFMAMLMTAAGTVKAARVLVLGAGVAGLQAIATAKRLGAVIEASDVRPAVKEQIESLGGKFVEVPYETQEERDAAEGVGGYARPMPASWLARQAQQVHERAKLADIVITTALIPGRDAPTLLSEETVKAMRPGSVVVDLAAGRGPELADRPGQRGGNCPLTEADRVVTKHGVTIVGHTNLPAMVAADASSLYARNLFDFLKLIVTKEGALNIDLTDDIVAATLIARDGATTRTS